MNFDWNFYNKGKDIFVQGTSTTINGLPYINTLMLPWQRGSINYALPVTMTNALGTIPPLDYMRV